MATFTTAASGNDDDGATWVGGVAPSAGDDLIIGAHTLTLNRDITYNSITFNSASSKISFSGASRTVIFTNGLTVAASGVSVMATTPASGNYVIRGTWKRSGNLNNTLSAIVASAGANITLATIGDDPNGILMEGYAGFTGLQVITNSWTGGTLTTIGRFDLGSWSANSTLVTMTGGTWNHTNTGTSLLGAGAHTLLSTSGTGCILNWSGNLTSSSSSISLFSLSSANQTVNITNGSILKRTAGFPGANLQAGNYPRLLSVAAAANNCTVNLDGVICTTATARCVAIDMACNAGGRLNWRNQARTIPSTDAVVIWQSNTVVTDMINLQISNAGRFQYFEVGTPSVVVDSLTTITNTTTSAQACVVSNSGALDGKVINLASDAPTLPTVSQVAGGTVYGYSASPLTGTGVISDPAVIAAAVGTALESISATALRRFVTIDTGETGAANGSVAKLAQGGTVDLSSVLDKLPVSGRAATASDLSVTVNPTVLSAGSVSDIRSGLGTSAKQDQILTAVASIEAGGLTTEQAETLDSIAVAFAGSAPVETTGATETVMARLTRIEAATGSILGGRVLRSAGPVTPAGDISLVVGSDYVEDIDGSLLRAFSDPGASIHAKLTAGALSELVFSAAEKPSDPATKRIAGTITEVSEADGVTSVRIEILRTAIPVGPYSSDWKYHIWREADDLVSPPLLEGCLTLEWRA